MNGYMISSSADNRIIFWNTITGELFKEFRGHSDWVIAVEPMTDTLFASGGNDKKLFIWNINSLTYINAFAMPEYIWALKKISNDKIAVGMNSDTIFIVYINTGQTERTIASGQSGIGSFLLSPDSILVSGGYNNLKFWFADGGPTMLFRIANTNQQFIRQIIDIPNKGLIASCGDDMTIQTWYRGMNERVKTFTGHTQRVNSIQMISNDFLISGSEDSTLKIWNINTGICMKTIKCNSPIWSLKQLSNGLFASGHLNGQILIWNFNNVNFYY
jgi:WD40 repeat protein